MLDFPTTQILTCSLSRYNLKRRVASLPPISAEVFSEKVVQARVETAAQEDKQGFQKSCDSCQKTYYSENSYRNHITSAKHKARLAAMAARANGRLDDGESIISSKLSLGDPAEDKSEIDTDAEVEFNEVVESLKKTDINTSPVSRPSNPHLSAAAQHKSEHPVSQEPTTSTTSSTATPVASEVAPDLLTLKVCLFCNYESPSAPLNVHHMERIHGMFIPEKQYLVDPEGLLKHLQTRVFELNECLSCGKVKANAHAVQTHMRDKSHCQIPYTTEEEQLDIGDFYDFRSTYSDGYSDSEDEDMEDAEEETKAKPKTKLGGKRKSKTEGTGENGEAEDGWETDSSESSLDSEDLHAVPAENHYHQYERLDKHPHHSRHDSRSHHQRDGWHAHNSNKKTHAVFYDDLELYLPSGRIAGHRSQRILYRQNLHNYAVTAEEREARQALEDAQAEDEMDVDDDGKPRRAKDGTHSRALITREMQGLMRFIDPKTREFKKVVAKGREKEVRGQKDKELEVSRMYFKQRHRNPVSYLR